MKLNVSLIVLGHLPRDNSLNCNGLGFLFKLNYILGISATAFEEVHEDIANPAEETPDMLDVDWLKEIPDDLDVCIAQRDFDGAVDLIDKSMSGFTSAVCLIKKEYKVSVQ